MKYAIIKFSFDRHLLSTDIRLIIMRQRLF